jgi:F420-dependent oxidoreductase-like protein
VRAPITLDLHLLNFNYPGVTAEQLFDRVVEIALIAERSGFGSISSMDHLQCVPGVGPQADWICDGPTMLAALAGRTSRLNLGLVVGGVTYRNPAHHAKITTTIDVISGGRAWHGIGAGWFEEEHNSYGFEFPPLSERFERLEEAVQIARSMFTSERTTFRGRHFSVEGALNKPQPLRGDIPILIGGAGERKTLRLVAQYADGCNIWGDIDRLRHLLDVLESHCHQLGRDSTEITKTWRGVIALGKTHEQAVAKVEHMRRAGSPESRIASTLVGDPDELAEQATALAQIGIEGMTFSLPDIEDLETVALAGRSLGAVFNNAPA